LPKKGKEQQKTPKKQVNGNEQKTPKKELKTPLKGQEKTPKGQNNPVSKTPDANKSLLNVTLNCYFLVYLVSVNYTKFIL